MYIDETVLIDEEQDKEASNEASSQNSKNDLNVHNLMKECNAWIKKTNK